MRSGAEPEGLARQGALEQACPDSGFVGIWPGQPVSSNILPIPL